MNKFKKFLLGLTAAAGLSCLVGAAACAKAPSYYKLVFEGENFDYIIQGALAELDDKGAQFISGGTVKGGVKVEFALPEGVTGSPVIYVNDSAVTPDKDNVYRFTIKGDTTVRAEGITKTCVLDFLKTEEVLGSDGQYTAEERWVTYLDEDGKEINGKVNIESGKSFKFKLKVSPYYEQKYTLSCGYEALTSEIDTDGYPVYTVTDVQSDAEVSVAGLELATPFFNRDNCGDGTEDNPYLLSQPVDMFYMAAYANMSDFYGNRYSSAYYKLAADIDMKGEKLFVTGDGTGERVSATFSGSFDGDGHAIKNFRLTDQVVDQTTYTEARLRAVGLFGYAVSDGTKPVVIKNLRLEGFNMDTDTGEIAIAGENDTRQAFAGALVGYGVGVQISDCSVQGKMVTNSNYDKNGFVVSEGGMAGYLRSAYTDNVRYDSFVRACSADVTIEAHGSPYSVGGIVGYLESSSEDSVSYIYNSYTKGSVVGGIRTGGIVGTAGFFTSVSNCYSAAEVVANNDIKSEAALPVLMQSVSAGGIVGYLDNETVVYGCYAANKGEVFVDSSARPSASNRLTGDFVGEFAEAGATSATARKGLLIKNEVFAQGNPKTLFKDTLDWSDDEWIIKDNGELPTIKKLSQDRTYHIVVKKVTDGVAAENGVLKSLTGRGATPLYAWYEKGTVSRYVTDGDMRSWGYYFDEALTQRVPCGFLPVSSYTIYYGLSDYGEIEGTYYFKNSPNSYGAYVTLGTDGSAKFRNGGQYLESDYVYYEDNGEKTVEFYNTRFATLNFDWLTELSDELINMKGALTGGTLALSGTVGVLGANGYTTNTAFTLTASKKLENFVYGEYYTEDRSTYIFCENGTGVYTDARSQTGSFTLEVSGETATLRLAGAGSFTAQLTASGEVLKINNSPASKTNAFKGVWAQSAISSVRFELDGFGKAILSKGAARGERTETEGTYSIVSGTDGKQAEIKVGGKTYTAEIRDDGLVIDGVNYSVYDGFTGTWFMSGKDELVDIELFGVGPRGYGDAVITYSGNAVAEYNAQYNVVTQGSGKAVIVYVGDTVYAELEFDGATNAATGLVYSKVYNSYYSSRTLYQYDPFKGEWASDMVGAAADIDAVTFNGKAWGDASLVVIKKANHSTRRGTYALTDGETGTMTVDGKTYSIKLDEESGKISVSLSGATDNGALGKVDAMHGVVLYDGAGNSYTFNGKSNLGDGKGKVDVSDGNSYVYTVEGGVVKVGGQALTPNADGDKFEATLDGTPVTLGFETGFAGEWLVSGQLKKLTVEEVRADFTAIVRYEGVSGEFTFAYDPVKKQLVYSEEAGNGVITTTLSLTGNTEMSISRRGADVKITRRTVKYEGRDKWFGTFSSEDGESWTFDGLGGCVYAVGTAVYKKSAAAEPETYNYYLGEFGEPYIIGCELLFLEADDGEEGFKAEDGETVYKTVMPDSYYGRKAYAVRSDGSKFWYYFDGRGKVYILNEGSDPVHAFDYKIVYNTRCEITAVADGDGVEAGVKYNCEFSEAGMYIVMSISEQSKITMGSEKFAIGLGGVIWRISADGVYTEAYTYVMESETVLTLTDSAGKKYDAILTKVDDNSYTMTISEKEAK